jgi:DNA-binding response OmpR family regulator
LTADKVEEYGPLPKNATLFFKPLSFDELDAHISAIITRKNREKQVAADNV